MNIVDIINKKRCGKELDEGEISFFVNGYTSGAIADYQAAALLMAVCINGMTPTETTVLTLAMRDSGDKADLSDISGFKIDKHSTGGVGDKTTLVVAPVVAACGLKVAKMSGRGLGHTGGTIDKLESVPGFRTTLGKAEFTAAVNKAGLSVIGQSGNLAPADKKLYALRDVTGTVESLPLIASSIMSKKLAADADGIVLDVKVGSGAFCKTEEQALRLAQAMVAIGNGAGKKTSALLTDMETPLGTTVGNALEVREAIETLHGEGEERFTALCLELATAMLVTGGKGSEEHCRTLARRALESGAALSHFAAFIEAQGGNAAVTENTALLPQAKVVVPLTAQRDGYIVKQDAFMYGRAALELGAGRKRKEDGIDPTAGIVLNKKYGDRVKANEAVAYLHTSRAETVEEAMRLLLSATEIGINKPTARPIIIGRVQ